MVFKLHPTMEEFLTHLEAQGRRGSLRTKRQGLARYWTYLESTGVRNPRSVTRTQLQEYQRWLAEMYVTETGKSLKKGSQAAYLSPVLAFFHFLAKRGLILNDPARGIKLPRPKGGATLRDYLDLQEAIAFVQTQAGRVLTFKEGSRRWIWEYRNLALLCLGLATGKRRASLISLKVADLDLDRCELRIDWEKGHVGRVVPVAKWAVDVCRLYLKDARPLMFKSSEGREDRGWLFPGFREERMAYDALTLLLARIQEQTINENPDLEELPDKNITPHSLRVTYATLLFKGGCSIRSINELMNHARLTETARYTPIPLEDLARTCRQCHPRA